MSTLDALLHVFEVDPFTGFMARLPPLTRLPAAWETWEATLDAAINARIQLGDKLGLTDDERATSRSWRLSVLTMPVLAIPPVVASASDSDSASDSMMDSAAAATTTTTTTTALLRRAHLVLTYLQHFYVHSLPPEEPPRIPRSIAVPLIRVSRVLKIPPLLTYSDTVLYNWRIDDDDDDDDSALVATSDLTTPVGGLNALNLSALSLNVNVNVNPATTTTATATAFKGQIRSQTTFTSTRDEESFYLCSAHIELCGAQALHIIRGILDESLFIGRPSDALAVRRIAHALVDLARVIGTMQSRLEDVRRGCDPDRYFGEVRPWFNGQDVDRYGRRWVFEMTERTESEGKEMEMEMEMEMEELSGPSAGQSSIVHVLDVFLGVDHEYEAVEDGKKKERSFMSRMKRYMPYQHRLFIEYLEAYPRPLRAFVAAHAHTQGQGGEGEELKKAYNEAVGALKRFRDAHMVIAALYILGPARRARERALALKGGLLDRNGEKGMPAQQKGTGGTELVGFLKETRRRTVDAVIT